MARKVRGAGQCGVVGERDFDRMYPDVDAMPPVDLRGAQAGLLVCDAVFNPPETRLLAEARRLGLPLLDGLRRSSDSFPPFVRLDRFDRGLFAGAGGVNNDAAGSYREGRVGVGEGDAVHGAS